MISGGYYKSCLFDRNWKVSTAPMVKCERLLSQLVRVCEDFQVTFTGEFLLKLSSLQAGWIYNASYPNDFLKYRNIQQQWIYSSTWLPKQRQTIALATNQIPCVSTAQTTRELQNLNWYKMVRPTDIVRTCHQWLKKAVELAWSAWLVLKHLSWNFCPRAKIHSCLQGGNVSRLFCFLRSSLAKLKNLMMCETTKAKQDFNI